MRMLAVIALATAMVSPTMAQAPQARDQIPKVQPPAERLGPPIMTRPAPDAFARGRQPHLPNTAWDVYKNGKYVGSDPAPGIRDQLRREQDVCEE